MTKELYPRPRAKVGETVVYASPYPDGSCKYFQAVIDLADCVDQWRYSTECSANDFYDEDIVENLTTGSKLVDGEWKTVSDMAHEVNSEYIAKKLEQDSVVGGRGGGTAGKTRYFNEE
jgi:hypothetical protein